MLKLVVDNKEKSENQLTCRDCELFDPVTKDCGVWDHVDVDNPTTYNKCQFKQPFGSKDDDYEGMTTGYFEEDHEEELFQEFKGNRFDEETSQYPHSPDIQSSNNDAKWYISPDKSYGCWIINKSKTNVISTKVIRQIHSTQKNKYYSPFPLHDHQATGALASRLCWYVSPDGMGQYAIDAGGEMIPLQSEGSN